MRLLRRLLIALRVAAAPGVGRAGLWSVWWA